jgi:hypothetical protein
MAIIRIKRTTGNLLPEGLTFGELAFVGASGGYTANRLYIAGPQGTCIWVGAQILNQPTYWSGATAETTIPTVSAVESRITSQTVNSFNGLTGSIQGVSAIGATNSSWLKLAVSFPNAYSTTGATGYVNVLGATWADSTTTNGTVGGIGPSSSLVGKTVFEILQQIFYVYQSVTLSTVSFSGFSTTSGNNLEVGQTLASSSSTTNITTSGSNTTNINANNGFGVTYATTNTTAPAGSCASGFILGYTGFGSPKNNITVPTNFHATSLGATVRFRASAAQNLAWEAFGSPNNASGTTANSSITTYTWYQKMYWGKSANDALTDYTLLAEGSNALNATTSTTGFSPSSLSISSSATAKYLYIFVPNYYTVTSIKSGGVAIPLKNLSNDPIVGTPPTATITNSHGVSITYNIYQSTNTYFDAFTLVIA